MSHLAIAKSQVDDMMELLQAPPYEIPIDPDKCDYNDYGDHRTVRPYKTVSDGISWYLHQHQVSYLPDELIISLVAHNFGMSLEEAKLNIEDEINISSAGLIDFE